MDPLVALNQAVYFLDRGLEPGQKVRAFQRAAAVIAGMDRSEVEQRARAGTLTELDGIGPSTAQVVTDAVLDRPSTYLAELEARTRLPDPTPDAARLRQQLRGDLHTHTVWSDGGASVETMVRTAAALGHEYMVITDHSARLTIAHGLSPERLTRQLDEIDQVRNRVAPFRILTGMEVDILEDGSLDLPQDHLSRLDVVVASVHSKLSMPADEMTRRMVAAVASPHVDVLGHCTGRKLVGRGRAPSKFDADMVFAACARFGTAVEINSRPERLDPPDELVLMALDHDLTFAVDSDAHAPGQLEWQPHGCEIAARNGVPAERIVNTWPVDDLLAWTDRSAA